MAEHRDARLQSRAFFNTLCDFRADTAELLGIRALDVPRLERGVLNLDFSACCFNLVVPGIAFVGGASACAAQAEDAGNLPVGELVHTALDQAFKATFDADDHGAIFAYGCFRHRAYYAFTPGQSPPTSPFPHMLMRLFADNVMLFKCQSEPILDMAGAVIIVPRSSLPDGVTVAQQTLNLFV